MKNIAIIILIISALLFTACSNASSQTSSDKKQNVKSQDKPSAMKSITGKDLDEIQDKKSLENTPIIIDVRSLEEYRDGHLRYAVSLPLDEIQNSTGILDKYKEKPVIVYCRSGRRSKLAADILLKSGFTNITNSDGVSQYKYKLINNYTNLTGTQLDEKLKSKDAVILDIREKKDYDKFHIEKSINIPSKNISSSLNKIPKDKEIVIYSYNGYESAEIANLLSKNGYKLLYNAIEGTNQYDYNAK